MVKWFLLGLALCGGLTACARTDGIALEGQEGPFDLILMDPPYDDEDAPETLSMLASKLAEDGWIVYEHGSRYNPPERPAGLSMAERRVYGDTAVAFYRREEAA